VVIREARIGDREELISLIAEFRVALASFRGVTRNADTPRAEQELESYQKPTYRTYVAEMHGGAIGGYLVCKVDENVVWAESIYVKSELRREGVGSALYQKAEILAEELGGATVYNWVHPNNERIIGFLRKRGYDVLNLVEVRRRLPGEQPATRINVGDQVFEY